MNHDDAIYWPNGRGYTECTAAYRKAVEEQKRHDIDDARYHELDGEIAQMQQDGHMGHRITFDAPDPLIALLGGSKVRSNGDGTFNVVNVPGSRIIIKDPNKVLS